MKNQISDLEGIQNRLEKLEKQNRALKRIGLFVLLLVMALLVSAWQKADAKKDIAIPEEVQARRFVVKDKDGHTRAQFGMHESGISAWLTLNRADGHQAAALTEGYLVIGAFGDSEWALINPSSIHVTGTKKRNFVVNLGGSTSDTSLLLSGPGESVSKPAVFLLAGESMTQIDLSDQGYRTVIGSVDLQTRSTGETHKTSAASLTMFDKEKKVIWRAP